MELVDLIQSRFPDRIARRRFDRQVADIADQVAERLLSLCGHEYGGLRKNDKAAAIAAAVDTLTSADLSDEALFSADVDSVRLASRLRAKLPHRAVEVDLGEAGARLYDVVLDECCDCLVRIVRQLPQFGPRASAETLARLSGLADKVSVVLARLPVRTLDAPAGTATDEAFRRRYLEHVSVSQDVLELFGIHVERYRPRTTLSVAYISLSVSTDNSHRDWQHAARRARSVMHIDEWLSGRDEPGQATVRVEAALGHAPLTLIRGEAGSGKSTLLRWLAISAARGTFAADLADWNGCVPFLIKLRSYTGRALPPPERFLEGAAGPVAGLMPAGWVHRQLGSGQALLLVDGVDELPGTQRRPVRPWLAGLVAAYPTMRVVVTSRPAAVGSDWLAAEGFATAFLDRMTPSDVKELIRHWHEAIRDAADLPCEPEELPGFEAALLARMESAPHLRALAGSPLLAAMLCALNLDREKQLPRDRMGLYAAALELLLERRDTERHIQADERVALERSQKLQILQDLAWRLSITGRIELPKDAVVRWTRDKLAAMPRAPQDPDAVLDYLLQRSGILREPIPGRVDFIHRTIQEYLTAKQFTDDGDLEPLIAQAHRDQWRETIIMAAGHANAPQRTELLSQLLARAASEPRYSRRFKLLVAGCLETLPAIPPSLRRDVDKCCDDLIPPRDLASARSLSSVGEPILSRLPSAIDTLSDAAARAVVRTAWLINGSQALEVLGKYGSDPRNGVQEELIQGWEYFDANQYAQRVLADAPLVSGYAQLPTGQTLAAAHHLTHLKVLSILRFKTDLSFLRTLPQSLITLHAQLESTDLMPLTEKAESLTDLYIRFEPNTVIADTTPLLRLPNLQKVSIYGINLQDLDFVASLPQLLELNLGSLINVDDLSPLRTQQSLQDLALDECPKLSELNTLPRLENVTRLRLTISELGSDIDELADRAPNLRSLYLDYSPHIRTLDALAGLDLTELGLWGCKGITDFTFLANFKKLTFLDLEDTNISDLSPLSVMTSLQTLWLRHCTELTDLAPLSSLRQLRRLYIEGIGGAPDLAPLAKNPALNIYIGRGQVVENREMLRRRITEG